MHSPISPYTAQYTPQYAPQPFFQAESSIRPPPQDYHRFVPNSYQWGRQQHSPIPAGGYTPPFRSTTSPGADLEKMPQRVRDFLNKIETSTVKEIELFFQRYSKVYIPNGSQSQGRWVSIFEFIQHAQSSRFMQCPHAIKGLCLHFNLNNGEIHNFLKYYKNLPLDQSSDNLSSAFEQAIQNNPHAFIQYVKKGNVHLAIEPFIFLIHHLIIKEFPSLNMAEQKEILKYLLLDAPEFLQLISEDLKTEMVFIARTLLFEARIVGKSSIPNDLKKPLSDFLRPIDSKLANDKFLRLKNVQQLSI
ncbi:MAG: hypothetical protein ACOYK9_05165 [Chlamydiia bacterium]